MKTILLICLLIGLGLQVTVTDADKCSACTEFKSQTDCENTSNKLSCEWKTSACAQKTTTTETLKSYCENVADPATQCAKTFGCAYVDSKCTHFTGCTAYVKTTIPDCQAISYLCITNGTTCDDVLECDEYETQIACEGNPSLTSPYKCKWESDKCRKLNCSEADTTLNTTPLCVAWKSGCVTTGYGCIDVAPNCNQYTGTADSCNKMVGKDGKCTLDSTSTATPQACKLRICSEAALTTWSDENCGGYQTGCKSTGFSCVDALQKCSTYSGNSTSCLTFIGSDGKCTADSGATTCRERKCEDKVSAVLADCNDYAGCVTNGVTCVATLGNCNTYKGTITTCGKIIGLDGNCKGTSATDATVSCVLKDCAADDVGTEKTDTDCKKVQSFCLTTGKGCVKTFDSCTSYTDDGSCLNYIGSEGKCKAGAGGATPKCAARACTDNTTATTNTECQNYKSGCVTNGAGCVAEAACIDTVSKLTCTGTTNKYSCAWSESCVAKDCTAFSSNQSLCSNTKLSDAQPCIWKSASCVNAVCSDYTETDDTKCDTHMKGCITNGTKCADPANCDTEFTGTVTTCRGYKAQCTNTDAALATDACAKKTCADNNIAATSDSDCDSYLTDCLFAGDGKCISNTSDCTKYVGDSTDKCKVFTGYVDATTPRTSCWWQSGGTCTAKVCTLAKSMTNDTDCGTFLTGCVYDGDGSCVEASADCTKFKYALSAASDCQALKGVNGTQKCFDGASNFCKIRVCADAPSTNDNDTKCDQFLSGCLSTGAGCVDPTAACTSYTGTQAQCSLFKGKKFPCQRTLGCTAAATPASCAGKTDAKSNAQCVGYKSACALSHGTSNCIDQVAACTGYTLSSTASIIPDKVTYCNTVSTSGGANCAYDSATTGTCVARTCALWSSTLGVPCTSYAGPSSCSFANGVCYTPTTCESHTIPGTITETADKVTHCNKFQNSSNKKCTFDASVSATTCKTMNKCEEALSPAAVDDCYDQTGQSNCVLIGTACVTIKPACGSYDITAVGSGDRATFCPKLKANSSGVINLCKYSSGTTCADDLCEDITDATSQISCNVKLGCRYYSSACQTIKPCASYSFPNAVNSDALKLKFCQNMYDFGTTSYCSFTSGTTCSAPKSCSEYNGLTGVTAAGSNNLTLCNTKRDKTGVICTYLDNATACSAATSTDVCTLITTGITADSDCDLYTTPLVCKNNSGACAARSECTTVTPESGSELADCQALTGPDGYYCSYTASTCSVAPDCSTLSGTQLTDCNTHINKHGVTCSWVTSATSCSDPIAQTCIDAVLPTSQADCDLISAGCIFYNTSCIKNSAACTDYTLPGSATDNTQKLTYCNGRVTTGGSLCTYTDASTTCVAVAACSTYTAGGTDFATKLTFCQTILTTDNNGCTFLSGGTKCLEVADLCTSYTVAAGGDCTSLKDTLGRSCIAGASTTCAYAACSTVSSPGKQDDCDAVVPGCLYYSTKCLVLDTCASYTPGGSAISYCGGLKDKNGLQCYADADADTSCKGRTCADAATSNFTTHEECQAYSPMCKSDGVGCIDLSTACTSQNGDATSCAWFLDATGFNKCGAPTDIQGTCVAITCEMNVTAANQTDCDNFIEGGKCKWKNPGCYDSTIACSKYRGTLTDCLKYVGNDIPCYSDSTSRGECRDRTCADKTGATSDDDCKTFLSSCLYNGKGGCVDKNESCSSFYGTSSTCINIKGVTGTQLCWSGSTTVNNCKVRDCEQLSGTSDSECEAFMPNTNCITNGTKCVIGPKTCNQFSGNDDTCGKFTASNGPCKASSQSVSAVACTPKVCYEAPNTYTTDAQCKAYHSSCKTNGRGCQSTVLCGDYQNKTVCGANSSCLWAQSCRMTYTSCSSLTSQGQAVCVNNPGTKCAWFSGNGVSANAVCRDYQCPDYDATLTTHDACQKASNNKCTTTGAGCVAYSTCSTYTNASMCAAAQTTETSKKCTWENAICRQQQCKDLKGTTDDECKNQLSGCKTNGTTCIGPTYSCSDFNGSQKLCLIDSAGQPCLYVGGTCYSYDECTDVTSSTQTFCQTFSTNCVVGQTTCVALNQCSKYDQQVSCLIGVSKTTCGWTPDQKCAEFKQCGDQNGTTWADCAAWNSSCVSDGTTCVPIGDCTSYLKQLSCENNQDTAKNACFWTGAACRQKQCSDVTATTDADCVANIVKEGFCTTDGTKCLVRAACTAYASEAACTVGADGIPCTYNFAVGQTTGNKSCRAEECTDIVGTTNDQCVGKINKKPCVSNGKNCVAQGTCASYKNKLSCAAGGSDNSQCVFTAVATTADPLAGTCVAFTTCASANGDKTTCLTNPSCKYTDTTNKCETTDCATFNGSGKCNPFQSFDGKTFTLCISSTAGCAASDPSTITQADCWTTTKYTYTWNASTNKCSSCKGSSNGNNSNGGNTTTNDTTTDSGYVLGASVVFVLLGFMA